MRSARIIRVDSHIHHNGDQTRTCRENCLFLALPPPNCVQTQRLSTGGRLEVDYDSEDFRKLCDTKRTDSYHETL